MTIFYAIIIGLAFVPLLYGLTVYLYTRVPSIATPSEVLARVIENLPVGSNTVLYDLGCGRGKLLFAAEKLNPKKLIGYELSPIHVFYARLKARILGSKVDIRRGDFIKADISDATIVYLFLVPSIVQKVWEKIKKETKPGTLVITLADAIPSANLIKQIPLHPDKPDFSKMYIYRV